PYRPAWEKDRIIAYLQKQSGTHFDPDVVIAFMEILPELDF
ncbi:MAG: two-component system response regulator, partial [Anaerolineaceae bacterium]|nr:two-component system response regulator [Anaerolineaceae bacterium]